MARVIFTEYACKITYYNLFCLFFELSKKKKKLGTMLSTLFICLRLHHLQG